MYMQKNQIARIGSTALISGAVGLLMFATSSMATTENVNANVEFVATIGLTEVNALDFGLISLDFAAANTVAIATNDALTDANSRVVGGTQQAAEVTVTATASKAAHVEIQTVVNGTGYTLGSFVCNYNGAGSGDCATGTGRAITTAASAALLIGATITYALTPVVGAANGSFDVVVTYD